MSMESLGGGCSADLCCATTCRLPAKQLILLKRCMPLRQTCGSTPDTIFTAGGMPIIQFPVGVLTFLNTSSECSITFNIADGNEMTSFEVLPQSSLTKVANGLRLVTYQCTSHSSTLLTDFCTGMLEADLQYCVSC